MDSIPLYNKNVFFQKVRLLFIAFAFKSLKILFVSYCLRTFFDLRRLTIQNISTQNILLLLDQLMGKFVFLNALSIELFECSSDCQKGEDDELPEMGS